MRAPLVAGLVLSILPLRGGQQPQFRTRVDLVQVDVVVTDRDGNPVSGLTRDDFTILEAGRPQAISQFAAFSIPLGDRTVDRRRPPAARDVFTNTDTPSPRALVVLIDSLHLTTDAEELDRTRRALTAILTDAADHDDIAIVFTGRSDLSVPFTRDLGRLVPAIENVRAAAVARTVRSTRDAIQAVVASLWTVRNAVDVLEGTPYARRVILYVGEGSFLRPEPPSRVYDEVQMTVRAATRAGVVIHAIDPRGVQDAESYLTQRAQRDFLSAVVLDTGGSVVASAADTRREIQKVMRRNGTFYVLGFVPPGAERDDGFHPIEVKVRDGSWKVSARKGYYPRSRTDAAAGPEDPVSSIEEAIESGLPNSGVPLAATASPIAPGAGGRITTLVTLAIGGRQPETGWDAALVVLTPDGKVLGTTTEHVKASGTPGPRLFHRAIDLPRGARPVRVIVRDRENGTVGSLHLTLSVPDLRDEGELSVGGIMIGGPPRDATLALPVADFEPGVNRMFSAGESRSALACLFWPGDRAELDVTGTIRRAGETLAATTSKVQGTRAGGRWKGEFRWELPLERQPPGAYLLEVSATSKGRRVASVVPFGIR